MMTLLQNHPLDLSELVGGPKQVESKSKLKGIHLKLCFQLFLLSIVV